MCFPLRDAPHPHLHGRHTITMNPHTAPPHRAARVTSTHATLHTTAACAACVDSLQGYNRPGHPRCCCSNCSHLLLQPRAAALGCCSWNNLKMPHKSWRVQLLLLCWQQHAYAFRAAKDLKGAAVAAAVSASACLCLEGELPAGEGVGGLLLPGGHQSLLLKRQRNSRDSSDTTAKRVSGTITAHQQQRDSSMFALCHPPSSIHRQDNSRADWATLALMHPVNALALLTPTDHASL